MLEKCSSRALWGDLINVVIDVGCAWWIVHVLNVQCHVSEGNGMHIMFSRRKILYIATIEISANSHPGCSDSKCSQVKLLKLKG